MKNKIKDYATVIWIILGIILIILIAPMKATDSDLRTDVDVNKDKIHILEQRNAVANTDIKYIREIQAEIQKDIRWLVDEMKGNNH